MAIKCLGIPQLPEHSKRHGGIALSKARKLERYPGDIVTCTFRMERRTARHIAMVVNGEPTIAV